MDGKRRAWRWACLLAVFGGAMARGQSENPSPGETGPLLALGSPALRSTMERWNLPFLYPASMPDFRLKVNRPTMEELSAMQTDMQLRGVEFRLPMEGFWVGYETPVEGEDPRATFSIQRGF